VNSHFAAESGMLKKQKKGKGSIDTANVKPKRSPGLIAPDSVIIVHVIAVSGVGTGVPRACKQELAGVGERICDRSGKRALPLFTCVLSSEGLIHPETLSGNRTPRELFAARQRCCRGIIPLSEILLLNG